MKKNETPQLSSSWWKGAQPDGLSAAKDLERALVAYEDARKDLGKTKDEASKKKTGTALDAVDAAAKKLVAELEKLAKNPPKKADPEELQFAIDSLKKYPRVIESVAKDLGRLVEASSNVGNRDEDEDDGGVFVKLDAYQEYLRKMLKRLRNAPLNFAVGLGKKPDEHRFVFHRAKAAKALAAAIKQETTLKRMTWGLAGAHPEKPTMLTLALEGPQAPGLKKKAEKHLKLLKPLPFDKIMLMVEGEEVEDLVDPEDTEAEETENEEKLEASAEVTIAQPPLDPGPAFAARLKALLGRIQQLAASDAAKADGARLKASEAGVFARKKDFAAANGLLDEAETMLGRPGQAAPAAPARGSKVVYAQSRLAWIAARNKVHAELQKLEAAILETYRDNEAFAEIRGAVRKLDGVLEGFDETLADKLDEAGNTEDAANHAALLDEARAIIKRYRSFLARDPLVQELDSNPFVPIAVQSTIEKTLALLETKLV